MSTLKKAEQKLDEVKDEVMSQTKEGIEAARKEIEGLVDEGKDKAYRLRESMAKRLDDLKWASKKAHKHLCRASDRVIVRVKDDPVKSLAVAAAAGAVVAVITTCLLRSRR